MSMVGVLAVTALMPGVASAHRNSPPPSCTDEATQPFLAYGDPEYYRLAPGGDFEGDLSDFDFQGDVGPVADSSPIGGDTVLSLAPGSSVTTPPICTDGTELFSRMFSRSADGDPRAAIVVEAIAPSGRTRLVGITRSDDDWGPTSRFLAPLGLARSGSTTFQYRFTAIGRGTTLIDGIYVDPRIRG
jgi:hypothetical protein